MMKLDAIATSGCKVDLETSDVSESKLIVLLSGRLEAPRGYISVDIYGHGEALKDEWPRWQNGHPVVNGVLSGTQYIVPPKWIKPAR